MSKIKKLLSMSGQERATTVMRVKELLSAAKPYKEDPTVENKSLKYYLDQDLPGVFWGGGYKDEYAKYERAFPFAFPYANRMEDDRIRYVRGEDGYWYDPEAEETGRALLSFTGDLMCEQRQQQAYRFGNQHCFQAEFRFVRNVFRNSDFVAGNLETTLTDLTPYTGEWQLIDGKYHCNAPKAYLDALRYAGFDALVNANNHNCDSAVMGLMDTLDALDEYRFIHTGTFHPEGDPRFALVKVKGIRIALLSYATYFNQLETNFTELGREKLLNAYDRDKMAKDVADARAAGAELVFVYIHWGQEYTHNVNDLQKQRAAEIAGAGADYIIGSHSHCLQPRDEILTSDGRKVPVIYSMGNFVTNETRMICKHTGILQLFVERKDGGIKISERFIPCFIYDDIRGSAFAPVPTDIALNGGVSSPRLNSARDYVMKVMNQLQPPVTGAISINEICEVLSIQRPESIPDRYATRLASQPSDVVPGTVFFGIIWRSKTELTDVIKKGAIAVITNRQIEGLPCLVVPDTTEAYIKVYSTIKKRFDLPTILVTGSVGKTTTKQIMENILNSSFSTLASPGNNNTRHTAMLVMQRLREYHEVYLQEVHEGDPKSAYQISNALMPDCCVITNIDSPHRENFNTEDEFINSFFDVASGLKDTGVLFVNGDDPKVMHGVENLGSRPFRIMTFGVEREDLDYRAENIRVVDGQLELDVVRGGKRLHAKLDSPVEKNAYNVAVAVAIADLLGIPEDRTVEAIARYQSDGIRQNVIDYRGLKMMLDCRSAAPTSAASSIRAFCQLEPAEGGRRVIVIGEMHLDGKETEREHRRLGALIAAETGADYLLCYGPAASFTAAEAKRCGFPADHVMYFQSKTSLEKVLKALLRPGDTLLIKGGRRMYLNSTIRKLFGYTFNID
ncbi:MAG: CapA family protein [Oscillospiraceae bacterium]|nr:CapA family protein [Oscillospiraceae bacterium]